MHRPRLCARPGCGDAAAATLSFQYATSTVWLDDLGPREPSKIDLCSRHADRLAAPKGWTGHDRRTGAVPSAGREDQPSAEREQSPPAGSGEADLRAQAS